MRSLFDFSGVAIAILDVEMTIAIQKSLSLVTRNEKDFTGIQVVNMHPWSM